ncbi:42088_t:CDS:1, partial [Gigaspora margarita]
ALTLSSLTLSGYFSPDLLFYSKTFNHSLNSPTFFIHIIII